MKKEEMFDWHESKKVRTDSIQYPSRFGEHEIDILRLDTIDSHISGNKWFKLKLNIEAALNKGYSSLLTFGGAFSNHIVATAKAGHLTGIQTIGIIRGEEDYAQNPSLSLAKDWGMELVFVSREEYKERSNADYVKQLNSHYKAYVVPEGGANYLGTCGAMEIAKLAKKDYDHCFVAAGTGSTAAGLMLGMKNTRIHAVSVLKGDFMHQEIEGHLLQCLQDEEAVKDLLSAHSIHKHHHLGGYAQYSNELISFMRNFHSTTGIPLDPIYTGKMALAASKILQGPASKVLLIHTGGLQGILGFESRYGLSLYGN